MSRAPLRPGQGGVRLRAHASSSTTPRSAGGSSTRGWTRWGTPTRWASPPRTSRSGSTAQPGGPGRVRLRSQQRWAAAHERGVFADEIVPVEIPQRKGDPVVVDTDEHPRPDTTLEALAKLRPAFSKDADGTVTAGNSSGVNDGAAALLLVEAEKAAALGLTPIAFVGPSASAGVEPAFMGIGPVPAVRKVLERAGCRSPTSARRAQRGVRGPVRRVRPRARARRGHRQRQRRRDRDRAPARVQRRAPRRDARPRDEPARRRAGARLALRRCRPGPRDGLRAGVACAAGNASRVLTGWPVTRVLRTEKHGSQDKPDAKRRPVTACR
jgi:hypothetical protein